MGHLDILLQIAVSLGLGLLVGLQREWGFPHVAGIRSFALIPPLGTICAHLSLYFGGWIMAAGFLSLSGVLVAGGVIKFRAGQLTPGITTNVAALLMYGVGAILAADMMLAAIVIGGCVAVLLHWKEPMHSFVKQLAEPEMKSIIQLVLFALVILPVLPNRNYGPYEVLNPFHMWLMVVLIVGISIGGYTAYKLTDPRTGSLLNGILGGVISSTATTVGFARQSSRHAELARLPAFVIMVASTVAFVRVSIEVLIVGPEIFPFLAPLLFVMFGLMGLLCGVLYVKPSSSGGTAVLEERPLDVKAAIVFGALYGIVLFAVAAAKEHFSDSGLYLVAALSGLTDMDAITLSATHLVQSGRLNLDTGCRMILVGALSNLLFKGLIVAALGSRMLFKTISIAFGISIAGGSLLLVFWPQIG